MPFPKIKTHEKKNLLISELLVEIPAKPDLRKSPRLQFLDTGLINHALGIQGELLALNDLSHAWKGTTIPHIITQEILSLNIQSYTKPFFLGKREKTVVCRNRFGHPVSR